MSYFIVVAGFTSVSALLQNTSMANGQQLDSSYNSNSGTSNASEVPSSSGVVHPMSV